MPMRLNASASTAAAMGSLSTSTPLKSKMTNGPSDPRPRSPAAVQLFEESTTRNISPVAAMQSARVISPIIMHRNPVRLWMTRRLAAQKPWAQKPGHKSPCRGSAEAPSVELAFDVFDAARQQIFGDLAFGRHGKNPLRGGNRGVGRRRFHVGERLR